MAKVEKEVEAATAELDTLVAEMVLPEAVADGPRWSKLSKSHDKTKQRLDKLTTRWEDLAVRLEEAEAENPNPS